MRDTRKVEIFNAPFLHILSCPFYAFALYIGLFFLTACHLASKLVRNRLFHSKSIIWWILSTIAFLETSFGNALCAGTSFGIENQIGRGFDSSQKWSRMSSMGMRLNLEIPLATHGPNLGMMTHLGERQSSTRVDDEQRLVTISNTQSLFLGLGISLTQAIETADSIQFVLIGGRTRNSHHFNASKPNRSTRVATKTPSPGTYTQAEITYSKIFRERFSLSFGAMIHHHNVDYSNNDWQISTRVVDSGKLRLFNTLPEGVSPPPKKTFQRWLGLLLKAELKI